MIKKSGLLVIIILLVTLGSFSLYSFLSRPKMALIEIQKVYDAFELKKELETKFKTVQGQRKKMLDSLELELKFLYTNIKEEDKKNDAFVRNFNLKKSFYLQKKQTVQEDDVALSQQYDKQILTQLNQYVKDYGKEKGYAYIFGTDGNGSVMYAEEKEDISEEVIAYINSKYKGVK